MRGNREQLSPSHDKFAAGIALWRTLTFGVSVHGFASNLEFRLTGLALEEISERGHQRRWPAPNFRNPFQILCGQAELLSDRGHMDYGS